jgi:IS5 family transposase
MLGDKAYDSAELREELDERGTRPVIPNRSNRKQPFRFSKRIYKLRWRIEAAFNRLKDFAVSQRATIGWPETIWRGPCSRFNGPTNATKSERFVRTTNSQFVRLRYFKTASMARLTVIGCHRLPCGIPSGLAPQKK